MRSYLYCKECKHYDQHHLGLKRVGFCPMKNIVIPELGIANNCKWFDGYGDVAKSDMKRESEEEQEVDG
jgi:hypothetical protein